MERKPLNIKTEPKMFRNLKQPGSKQSIRVSSARSASVRSNDNINEQDALAKSRSPKPENDDTDLQFSTKVRSPSNTSSRPATVSSVRSSVQGSQTSSPAVSVHSPAPSECSRTSTAIGSAAIGSPPLTAEKEVCSSSVKFSASAGESVRPESPIQSAGQSRLHTSEKPVTVTKQT